MVNDLTSYNKISERHGGVHCAFQETRVDQASSHLDLTTMKSELMIVSGAICKYGIVLSQRFRRA